MNLITIKRIENTMFSSNTWVLTASGGEGTWLVDCGDVEPVLPLIAAPLHGVLLTHAHFDHIYGLNTLLTHYPNATIYTNAWGREMLLDEYKNLSAYHDSPFTVSRQTRISVVDDGDILPLFGGVQARVHATPGHNPSCLTLAVGDNLFTGDAYIPGVKVVTILPEGDKQLAAASIGTIKRLAQGRIICPGHGNETPFCEHNPTM